MRDFFFFFFYYARIYKGEKKSILEPCIYTFRFFQKIILIIILIIIFFHIFVNFIKEKKKKRGREMNNHRIVKSLKNEQIYNFTKLLEKQDWEGIREWHQQNTPWCSA